MKTCCSKEKLMKQFGKLPFLSQSPFQLSKRTPLSEQFFNDLPLFQISKTRTSCPPNFTGEETMYTQPQTNISKSKC